MLANQRLADMQLQLLQSEKMASIGQLASGVAHEINNPIGFVKSNLGSLADYVSSLLEIVRAYEQLALVDGEAVEPALHAIEQRKKDIDYTYVVEDVRKLIEILQELVRRGNSVVVIEHNLDLIKCADYLIDFGPEGGTGGGKVVAKGTPEQVAKVEKSHTGRYLKKYVKTK